MGDSIEEQEDEDEVWFPTEDHDEYEPASKPEIMAGFSSYSNLQSLQLPRKSPVIYSTSTYLSAVPTQLETSLELAKIRLDHSHETSIEVNDPSPTQSLAQTVNPMHTNATPPYHNQRKKTVS